MTRRIFKIGTAVQGGAGPKPVPAPAPGIVAKVVRTRSYSGPLIDYQAEHRRKTQGLKSSKQIKAEAERAARKAAKAAEGTKPRRRALPPRELPNGID